MYNLKIKNNYLLCYLPDGRVAEGFRKSVEIHATDHTSNAFISFKYLNNWDNLTIPFSEVKVDGETLDINDFIEWATLNTGNYGIEQATTIDYTTLLQTIIDKLDLLKPAIDYTPKLEEIITAIENSGEKELVKPITEFTETIVGTDYEYLLVNTGIKIINSVEMGEEENINNTDFVYELEPGTTNVKLTTLVQIPSNYFVRITGPK